MKSLEERFYQRIFKATPGKILVLQPPTFDIIAVTNEYLQATHTCEKDILGKHLFDAFPDNPHEPQADGVRNLSASLERVLALKKPDIMGIQRYPVPRQDGTFEERYWSSINTPVFDAAGHIEFIMHRAEDVTEIVREGVLTEASGGEPTQQQLSIQEIILRAQELKQALAKLYEHETRMRNAEQMLELGSWELDLATGRFYWSNAVFSLFNKPITETAPTLEEYYSLVHPDDQAEVRENYKRFMEQQSAQLIFEHRVIESDGSVKYIKGVGERHVSVDGERVLGYVQNLTPHINMRNRLTQAERIIGTAERDKLGKIIAVQGTFRDISLLHEAQVQADQKERERLNILESISDAFFALDKAWNFTYLNQHAYIVLDRLGEDLLGKNVWTEFPAALGSVFESEYHKALDTQTTTNFQAFYPPLNKWFDVSAYPIPEGLAVYFRDVTQERKQQEQRRLVDAALSRLNDIVIITEAEPIDAPNGPRVIYVNDAFTQLTGYTKEQVLGQTPHLLQGVDTDRDTLNLIRTALHNKEPMRCELLNYSQAGKAYWVEIDITPLFDEAGTCTHFVAVERDISQRKHDDIELKQAQERYQLISKATNDVVWDWDLVSNEIIWNESVTEVFGYTLEELTSSPGSWIDRIHPEDREEVSRSSYGALESQEDIWRAEYRFLKRDGHYASVIDRGFVIRDKHGKATRMVGSMLDITDRKDMENRLRESQKLEAVGHLTGGVAHDFNNLLTVILGNAEMLVDELTDQRFLPMAEMMLSAAQRGSELTSRLLAYARRKPLDPTVTNLNQLVEGMRALIRRTLPEHIEFETHLAIDLGLSEIDAGELETAVLNLVINARDAMPEGGKLMIKTANFIADKDHADRHEDVTPGEYVMVCVSDTGIGMSPETIRHAFEPFYTTKPVGKGTGLGLSMVFGFTKQSGGHIKIHSEPHTGTTIKLYFPRTRTAQCTPPKTVDKELLQQGREHILVAEDDELVLQSLEMQLKSLGYRVTSVTNGQDAIKVLETHTDIDLLLTDIIMPGGMNGRVLAEHAYALIPELKVLFTSGYTDNALIKQGRLEPGIELLNKPYTRLELATKLKAVLRGVAR